MTKLHQHMGWSKVAYQITQLTHVVPQELQNLLSRFEWCFMVYKILYKIINNQIIFQESIAVASFTKLV